MSHCLFDKTGTLTTDQLVPVGIVNYNSVAGASAGGGAAGGVSGTSGGVKSISSGSNSSGGGGSSAANSASTSPLPALGEVITATAETAIILAACHSLVVVDDGSGSGANNDASSASSPAGSRPGTPISTADAAATATANANANLVGDPIELAAIKGIDWSWDAATSTASPTGGVVRSTLALSLAKQQLKALQSAKANSPQEQENNKRKADNIMKEIPILETKLQDANTKANNAMYSSVQVLQRHHFSSKLQRMSVVCRCSGGSGSSNSKGE